MRAKVHRDPAVIIIGAGVAGLAAACELGRSGVSVCVLEARDRIGGRIFTLRDRRGEWPIELGAEFIHGRPPEIWRPLKDAQAEITEVEGETWCVNDGRLAACDFFPEVNSILEEMDDAAPDESFLAFLNRRFPENKSRSERLARERAISYVSGFNAADPSLVGVHWLVQGMKAEEKIEGDRVFRSRNGYEDLLGIFRAQIGKYGITLRTGAVVESVSWSRDRIQVRVRQRKNTMTIDARRALVTLPISLLNGRKGEVGVVQFQPELPREKHDALQKLEMGKVIRIVLRFRHRFWEKIAPASNKTLAEMSFLLSDDEWFPTWWTSMPEDRPVITGWAPFKAGERLSGQSHLFVVERSLSTLGKLLGISAQDLQNELENAYFHDWQDDPFSRGAYSYGKVGADGAQQALGAPVEDTLFFAGEATDTTGHNGTVHGAIASGHRAAREILQTLG